jgi:hypothetical protein
MLANTSKSNVLLSNSAQSTRGVFSFIGSVLAAAWGATLASFAPAWGTRNGRSRAPGAKTPWNLVRFARGGGTNSGPQLWHMTRSFMPGQLQGWALYRGSEVSTKGYHGLDALAVELTESPAPEVKPIGSAAGAN